MDGMTVQFIAFTQLYQRAQVHNTDPVGNMTYNRKVMGNEQISKSHLLLHVLQHIYDLRLNRNIQCGDRLITYDKLRLNSQCTGNSHTLLLSA